jgi:hypothetical protein
VLGGLGLRLGGEILLDPLGEVGDGPHGGLQIVQRRVEEFSKLSVFSLEAPNFGRHILFFHNRGASHAF